MRSLFEAELGDRDQAILEAARDLRLVTGGQLRRLVFGEPRANSVDGRVARRVLQRLAEQGLLVRATRSLGGVRGGSSSYVYALGTRGARLLGERVRRQRLDPSLTFLRHTLTVGELFVELHEAARTGAFELRSVQAEPECWRPLSDGTGTVLKPDLFVRTAGQVEELFAYVEVDLATEHEAAVRRKAGLYRAHRATGRDQEQYGVFPFVLWVVPDPIRADTVRRYLSGEERRSPGLHHVVLAQDFINHIEKGGDHA